MPTSLAQVKTGNTSENLLNEIRQIIYSLYCEKGVIKKVYHNLIYIKKLQSRMDTMSMNSENGKTSDPHRSLLDLSVKLNLKRSVRYVKKTNNFSMKYM